MYGRLGYDGVSRKETVVGVSDRQPRLMDVVSEDNPAPVSLLGAWEGGGRSHHNSTFPSN